ncbi:MAG: hypothetical protein NC299_17860 [Lachnospiraceae bacterium]|nr:hypothetical protein [Lachnospiraceae bacterium]
MMKIDWKRKLTSRKLWIAIAGFAAGLILAFGGSNSTAETVTGCIMSGASVVGYILGEGLTDAAALKTENKGGENSGSDDN